MIRTVRVCSKGSIWRDDGACDPANSIPAGVLYAFDPRRSAILLIGGDKTGQDRWYEIFVSIADKLFDEHLAALKREG